MITILGYLWDKNPLVIVALIRLRLLDWAWGRDLLLADAQAWLGLAEHEDYAAMMRAPAYRRSRGGALRQVRRG
ncbi:MAG: hypothetical protein HPY52_10695 [Firmicutes bacterium]|nr:hypothetical protein [Bacillota bacterium]